MQRAAGQRQSGGERALCRPPGQGGLFSNGHRSRRDRTSCSPGVPRPLPPLPLEPSGGRGGRQAVCLGGARLIPQHSGEHGGGGGGEGVKAGKGAPQSPFLQRQWASGAPSRVSPTREFVPRSHCYRKSFDKRLPALDAAQRRSKALPEESRQLEFAAETGLDLPVMSDVRTHSHEATPSPADVRSPPPLWAGTGVALCARANGRRTTPFASGRNKPRNT